MRQDIRNRMDVGYLPELSSELSPHSLVPRGRLWSWIDTSLITGLNDGDTVESALDPSGRGTTWAQATAAYRPKFRTNQVNGLPALEFDGANYRLGSSGGIVADNFTYFLVAKPEATITQAAESTGGTSGLSGQRYVLEPLHKDYERGVGISLGTNYFQVFGHGSGVIGCYASFGGVFTNFCLFVVICQSRMIHLQVNGAYVRTGQKPSKVLWTSNVMGRGAYGAYKGRVAEFICINDSSWYVVAGVSQYLLKKYALPVQCGFLFRG